MSVNTRLPEGGNAFQNEMIIKSLTDRGFTQELSTPVLLPLGTPIYMELSTDRENLNVSASSKIIVEDCVAILWSDNNIRYTEVNVNLRRAFV